MTSRPPVSRRQFVAGVLAALGGFSGCQPLRMKLANLFDGTDSPPESDDASQLGKRPDAPVRDAVQLEIVFAERPLDDPLMGDELWDNLDQVGAVESTMRTKLAQHGFRVGHCGATPPTALQTLLGLKAQLLDFGPDADRKQLTGQRIGLPTNDDFEIQASRTYQNCRVQLDPKDESKTRDFAIARCVMRLTAERMQDGWVRMDFQPEIHHGLHQLRRVVTEGGFALRQAQEVVPVYALRFPMELSVHEMAVIGYQPSSVNSLGHHFFVGNDDDAQLQRLLVVRIAGMKQSAATRAS